MSFKNTRASSQSRFPWKNITIIMIICLTFLVGIYIGKISLSDNKNTSQEVIDNEIYEKNSFQEREKTNDSNILVSEFVNFDFYLKEGKENLSCFDFQHLPTDERSRQITEYLTKEGRLIKLICPTKAQNKIVVVSIKNAQMEKTSPAFWLEIFTVFPLDDQNIPSPQILTVYKNENNSEVVKLQKLLKDNSLVFSIIDYYDWPNIKTYLFPIGTQGNNTGEGKPFLLEYCHISIGQNIRWYSDRCFTVNIQENSPGSIFINNEELDSIIRASVNQ